MLVLLVHIFDVHLLGLRHFGVHKTLGLTVVVESVLAAPITVIGGHSAVLEVRVHFGSFRLNGGFQDGVLQVRGSRALDHFTEITESTFSLIFFKVYSFLMSFSI